jgi:UDP-glucuronate decarboxylase
MYNPPKIIKNPRMPVVVIAGGAGFLGSHLAEVLLSKNFRVVVIDNMETGNKNFIAHLTSHPRFGCIEHNLNTGLPEKIESCDAVVHLLGEEVYLEGPESINLNSLLTNSLSTYHLLELTRRSQAKLLLASSLNIYQGIISGTSLNQYFGATEIDERMFSYNEAKRYAETLAWEYFKKYSLDIRIARIPEAYGPRMDFKATSNLGRLLSNVVDGANLIVYGDGLDSDYYIYVSDAVEGLYECLVRPKTAGRIFNLCDSKAVTQLELAYLLKGLAKPQTRIVFRPVNKSRGLLTENRNLNLGNLRDIAFRQKIKIKDGIKLTLEFLGFSRTEIPIKDGALLSNNEEAVNPLPKVPEGIFNKNLKPGGLTTGRAKGVKINRRVLTYSIFVLLLFFAPFFVVPPISLAYNLGRGILEFRNLEADLNRLDLNKSVVDSEHLLTNLTQAQKSLGNLILLGSIKKPYLHLLASANYATKAANSMLLGLKPVFSYLANITPDSKGFTSQYPYLEADDAASYIDGAFDTLSLAEAELGDPSLQGLPKTLKSLSESLAGKIASAKSIAGALRGMVQIAPELLGYDSQKNYLVLLQNSNELRPTGGFIGSLVTIQTRGGKITNPQVEDIYDIDGQIENGKISIPAPKIIKDSFNTQYLHIRDANFDPSFPRSSEHIRTLYAAVEGIRVDGVFAIDLGFVKSLMKVLGPIFVSTYNETVTSDNLFERVQFHSEANYVPGKSNKKTFLSLLSQKFFEQMLGLTKDKYLPVLKSILSSLEEKHLLAELYTPSSALVSNLGFRGEIRPAIGDYLMVVDANVGSNKTNYFVKRSIYYEVERANRDGEVSSQLTVSYNHTGTSNAWPGGTYKNYLKILLPLKASLIKARLGSENGNEEDITSRVEIDGQDGKTTFALLLEIPIGSKVSVVFNYVLPPATFPLNGDAYDLLIQKQPGTDADPFRAKFTLPFGSNVDNSLSQGFTRQGRSVIYEGNLRKDLELSIPLSEK